MLVDDAIAYLRNKSINTCDRFKVLTGFDTQSGEKDTTPGYWFNELYQDKIIDSIERDKLMSNIFGFFTSDLEIFSSSSLKEVYKKGIASSASQAENQEQYIEIVAAYLEKNKTHTRLAAFEFTNPEQLIYKVPNQLEYV